MNFYKSFKILAILFLFAAFDASAQMFRNASFDDQSSHKSTYWYLQENFFLNEAGFMVEFRSTAETESEAASEERPAVAKVIVLDPEMDETLIQARRQRPIWVHGGDSIATAWGTRETLAERLIFAQGRALRNPDRLLEKLAHTPSVSETWYAGADLQGGLLGWLERQAQEEWVIFSTAIAGSRFIDDRFRPIEALLSVDPEEVHRVKLLTFSLGGNDLCRGTNPTSDKEAFAKTLEQIQSTYPDATIIPWKVPDVVEVRDSIFARLNSLPVSVARNRVIQYCRQAWNVTNCPAIVGDGAANAVREQKEMNRLLEERFGPLFDPFASALEANDQEFFNLISGDCFHPSRNAQALFVDQLSDILVDKITP